jgi:hypothetical protein
LPPLADAAEVAEPIAPRPDASISHAAIPTRHAHPDAGLQAAPPAAPPIDASVAVSATTAPAPATITLGPAPENADVAVRIVAGFEACTTRSLMTRCKLEPGRRYQFTFAVSGGETFTASLDVAAERPRCFVATASHAISCLPAR